MYIVKLIKKINIFIKRCIQPTQSIVAKDVIKDIPYFRSLGVRIGENCEQVILFGW